MFDPISATFLARDLVRVVGRRWFTARASRPEASFRCVVRGSALPYPPTFIRARLHVGAPEGPKRRRATEIQPVARSGYQAIDATGRGLRIVTARPLRDADGPVANRPGPLVRAVVVCRDEAGAVVHLVIPADLVRWLSSMLGTIRPRRDYLLPANNGALNRRRLTDLTHAWSGLTELPRNPTGAVRLHVNAGMLGWLFLAGMVLLPALIGWSTWLIAWHQATGPTQTTTASVVEVEPRWPMLRVIGPWDFRDAIVRFSTPAGMEVISQVPVTGDPGAGLPIKYAVDDPRRARAIGGHDDFNGVFYWTAAFYAPFMLILLGGLGSQIRRWGRRRKAWRGGVTTDLAYILSGDHGGKPVLLLFPLDGDLPASHLVPIRSADGGELAPAGTVRVHGPLRRDAFVALSVYGRSFRADGPVHADPTADMVRELAARLRPAHPDELAAYGAQNKDDDEDEHEIRRW